VATRPDSEAIAKSREAMRQKMNDVIASEPEPAPAFHPSGAQSQHEAISAAQQSARNRPVNAKAQAQKRPTPTFQQYQQPFPALQGPPSPLSADKQARLAELLRKYQADQVTPSQYHEARAKILAEP
jgi:hypothetical protein